jgi:hypothetical protein
MTTSRRQLLRAAATGGAAALAGCSGLFGGGGTTPPSEVKAEAALEQARNRQGAPVVSVLWQTNEDADHVTVVVENATSDDSAETALCGVGARVSFNGANGQARSRGPVGPAPNCEPTPNQGVFEGIPFGPGDTVDVTVTAQFGGGASAEIAAESFTITTPTPTPTPTDDG